AFLRAPRSTLVPYTTLFRSQSAMVEIHGEGGIVLPGERVPPEIVDRDLGPTGEPGDTQHRGHCHTHPHGHRPVRLTGHEPVSPRSEEHTSELQSRENLVCRL